MRFSTLQLLIVVPAWVAAFFISPFLQPHMFVTWKHDVAANEIRQIRLWALNQLDEEQNLKFSEFDLSQLDSDFGGLGDPWGNQYQIIELNRIGLLNSDATFHAFSFGSDGTSISNGDDLDDINSWNYDRGRYYGAMVRNDEMRSNLWRTLWLTPIVYLVISVGIRRFAPSTKTPDNNAMNGSR